MNYYSSSLLGRVRQHIAAGGIIAYPTESCFGLGCDPFNFKAINRLLKLKGRSKTKGLIVIAGNQNQLRNLIQPLAPADQAQIADYWPGSYSLLLATQNKVPANLIGKHAKIAVRVSKNKLVHQLCRALNAPVISTSANRSGFKTIKTYRECQRQFGKKVLVLPGLSNFAKKPSLIIDWETKKLLRG